MAGIPKFSEEHLQRLCEVVGHPSLGLTGSEIGTHLLRLDLADPGAGVRKVARVFDALHLRQHRDRCGNIVVAFVQAVMDPIRYAGNAHLFEARRKTLNSVLALCGLELRDDGKLQGSTMARTVGEAGEKADGLREELVRRGAHPDVTAFCTPELLGRDNFHLMLEASRSLAEKVRHVSGLTCDGNELADRAFGGTGPGRMPLVAFNSLRTDTEKAEHAGLVSLLKGLLGAFKNAPSHAPRISWLVSDQDLLDLLTTASLLHRRLDGAARPRAAGIEGATRVDLGAARELGLD